MWGLRFFLFLGCGELMKTLEVSTTEHLKRLHIHLNDNDPLVLAHNILGYCEPECERTPEEISLWRYMFHVNSTKMIPTLWQKKKVPIGQFSPSTATFISPLDLDSPFEKVINGKMELKAPPHTFYYWMKTVFLALILFCIFF